ncbi:MAG: MaoC family dehydratase [Cyclobacteriaceae bacterium]
MKVKDLKQGDRFFKYESLTPRKVSSFARAAGDFNPLHHNLSLAAKSIFSGQIASGPHTTSLLMGCIATHFSKHGPMVGLEFSFRFRKAVSASERIKIEMLIVNITPHQKLAGQLVDLRGRIVKENGSTAVGVKGLILLQEV